jgi:hypothetical protein
MSEETYSPNFFLSFIASSSMARKASTMAGQKFLPRFAGDTAEFLEQVAVEAEVRAQHLGNPERVMTMLHGIEDRFGQQRAEELYLFLVAGGTEPAPLAGKRQQVVGLAVIATDAGKVVLKIAAIKKLVRHLWDNRAQVP